MNKLVRLLSALVLLLFLGSCAGSYAPIAANSNELPKLALPNLLALLNQVSQGKSPSVIRENIELLKQRGGQGIFQICVVGSKQYGGVALLSSKTQIFEVGREWIHILQPAVVPLGEQHGRGFMLATEHPFFSAYPIRYLISAELPSGGSTNIEVAKAGAIFKIDQMVDLNPKETHSYVVYFDEPHETSAKGSIWGLVWKHRKTDPITGDTDVFEGKETLKRSQNDQLWIQVTGRTVELRSAPDFETVQKKEQPEHTIENLISLTMKRVDPNTGQ